MKTLTEMYKAILLEQIKLSEFIEWVEELENEAYILGAQEERYYIIENNK